jgi:AcrR family transcriptional regulator
MENMPDAKADNRALILKTTISLFAERGYEATGIAELCEASGITKPTLYHYYGSKRGLLDAIIAEKGEPFVSRVKTAASYAQGDRARGVPDGLGSIANIIARSAEEDPLFARLRIALAFSPPSSEASEAAQGMIDGLFDAVESFFRAAALDHGNMKGRSWAYAAAFIGVLDTYIGLYLAKRVELSEQVIGGAVRQFMYGIFS